MRKFVQPVSMPCTQEQFEADLRKPLEEMGYVCNKAGFGLTNKTFLVNNLFEDIGFAGLISKNEIGYIRHFIDHYNPDLFLAIAAMSFNGYWEGEWIVYRGELYKIMELQDGVHGTKCICVIENEKRSNVVVGLKSVHKATIQELVQHFANPV